MYKYPAGGNIDFWKGWKGINEFEKNGIESLKKARKVILENIPKDEIISIYCKGSLSRREMNRKSDVDIVVVLRSQKYYDKAIELKKRYRHSFATEIGISPLTMYEFRSGKRLKRKGSYNASSSRIIRHLPGYRLAYGKELDSSRFPVREERKELAGLITAFEKVFFPGYESNNPAMGFEMMVKQTLWLCENELWCRGIAHKHTWKDITSHFPNDHIANLALYYRNNPTKDLKLRGKFITGIRRYLDKLKREYL